MFYCEACRQKHKWNTQLITSFGQCEMCGKSGACYDTPSKNIPAKPKPPLGVCPRAIWIKFRKDDIERVIKAYEEAKLPVPDEWIEELRDL